MRSSIRRILNSLPLRMVAPAVAVICLVGIGLYFFVLRSVSEFADEQIKDELTTIASEVYDICDENFSELVYSGKMDDRKAVTIKKAFCLGAIEEYVTRNNIGCRLTETGKGALFQHRIEPDLLIFLAERHHERFASTIRYNGKTSYSQHVIFKPWGWHIDLMKDTKAYAPLFARVKTAYAVTGILLLLGLVLILLLQNRFLSRPLNRIITAIRRGRAPEYKGIYELEFLSDNLSKMMLSLEERNKWIEYLYRIAITNRGENFFNRVADALTEALGVNTLIVKVRPAGKGFSMVAHSRINKTDDAHGDPLSGLPCSQIVDGKKPILLPSGANERFPLATSLSETGAQSYAGIPIFDREGAVAGVMNVFGKRREFDEWDLNLCKTVCQMIAVEFEFLSKERDRLKLEAQLQKARKMEALGTLAGGVAHDLNNILSGIVSYPDLILVDLPEDSTLRKPLLTIKQSGERAAIIVQDLLTLARRGVAVSKVVNLNTIISEQLKSPEVEKLMSLYPGVTVTTRFEKDLPNIKGSATHLSKSVMNLISNAAEAMPDGGQILITTENRHIDSPMGGYGHGAEDDYVTVTVSDTGIGISQADMERIFEPFYTKKGMGRSGTGLGMAVVWGTIKDHNGYIDCTSREGEGTTFILHFPVTREETETEKSQLTIDDYMGGGESILVVDDVRGQRELASAMLRKLGYSVETVSSGEAAIDYMAARSADLLVLDMIMHPGIDGLGTYKRIVEMHPCQKAIIASGYSETHRVKEAQRLGAGRYVKKPYTLEKIGLAVKEALTGS